MVGKVALGLIISSILMVSGVTAENTGLSQDEIAVRKAIESYVETYNRGDASAAASHWSRDGSYLTQTGEYAKGPDKIRPALEKFFAENKGIQVQAAIFEAQLQSAGRAIAKGFAAFVGIVAVDDDGKRIDRIAGNQNIELHHRRLPPAGEMIVERSVTA